MKKINKVITSLVLGSMMLGSQAQASEDIKAYVGVGLGYSILSSGDTNDIRFIQGLPIGGNDSLKSGLKNIGNSNSINVNTFLGVKFNNYVGVEFGGSSMMFNKPSVDIKYGTGDDAKYTINASEKSLYADVLGYYPINENLNLIGSLGIARVKTEVSAEAKDGATADQKAAVELINKVFEENIKAVSFQPRIGVGLGYDVSENVNVRGMVRYQSAKFGGSDKSVFGSSVTPSIEVSYVF